MKTQQKSYIPKPLLLLLLVFCLISLNVLIASTGDKFFGSKEGNNNTKACGIYEGQQLRKGPTKGGCYYMDKSNKKVYVDKRLCNC